MPRRLLLHIALFKYQWSILFKISLLPLLLAILPYIHLDLNLLDVHGVFTEHLCVLDKHFSRLFSYYVI
jgi:hypothetical protein